MRRPLPQTSSTNILCRFCYDDAVDSIYCVSVHLVVVTLVSLEDLTSCRLRYCFLDFNYMVLSDVGWWLLCCLCVCGSVIKFIE